MATASESRAGHVETLRGLACLLLVAYHVIGNDADHGMHVAADSDWRVFTEIFMHLRMPLFSFISGYVFSSAVATAPELRTAYARKLRRIGIPFVVVSTLFYIGVGYAVPSHAQMPMWEIYFLPYEHYWYLQATLLIMALVLAVAFFAGGHRLVMFAALLPVSIFVFLLGLTFDPDLFALGSALYLLPYFLLGHLLRLSALDRQIGGDGAQRRVALLALGTVAGTVFLLDIASVEGTLGIDFSRQSAPGLALGLSSCLFLFFLGARSRPLEAIGAYSYSIYLFHVFATAAFRQAVMASWPDMPRLLFFPAALAVGLFVPILLHHLFIRHRASALLLLGIDVKPRRDGRRLVIGMAAR